MPLDLPDDLDAVLDLLRRRPDVEVPELVAVDAADRLVLAEARALLAAAGPGDVAVLDDDYGALALGALTLGAPDVRVATDTVTSERALLLNAADVAAAEIARVAAGIAPDSATDPTSTSPSGTPALREPSLRDRLTVHEPLSPAVVAGARIVLARLPRSLDALAELADLVAAHAAPDVVLLATGRLKHMSRGMNDVLAVRFGEVTATLAHGKARALVAQRPTAAPAGHHAFPRRARVEIPAGAGIDRAGVSSAGVTTLGVASSLEVVAHGAAFAGTTLDIGTRALLDVLGELVHGFETHRGGRGTKPSGSAESSSITEPSSITTSSGSTTSFSSPSPSVGPFFRVLDLGCGTGVLATAVALRIPGASVVATDRSAAAVLSAAATAAANGVGDRVATLRDDAAASVPDGSVDVVVCNPPFHAGAVVSTDIAEAMFRAAARVLRPGGELWVVWNSHLRYRPSLERVVGPTEQASRTPKFTVTRSVKR